MNKTYIIAEAGVNHNGNIDIALELIKQAKIAGANCIKFQTFKASQIVTATAPKAAYQLNVTDKKESQLEMLKKLELDYSAYEKLIKSCNELDIDFMSTPYNKEDADFLESLNIESFKIASGQLTEIPFLKYVASKRKKMIISVGMATLADIFIAVDSIRSVGNNDIVVLQCTTNYPSKIEDANLLTIPVIKSACKVAVGYSDHVQNNIACYTSVALGAEVVEKHFTLDKKMEGPDHSSSLNPLEFAELVQGIRNVELALGSSLKMPTEAEMKNSYGMKRSLVSNENLKAGTILKESHLGFKRPANGLSINYLEIVVGKKIIKDIKIDEPLQFSHIQWE